MYSEERPVITKELVVGEIYRQPLAYREFRDSYAKIDLVTTIHASGPIATYRLEVDREDILVTTDLDEVIAAYDSIDSLITN